MSTETSLSELQERADSSAIPPAAERNAENDEVSLLDLLILLAERRRLILSITVVFAVLAIIISLILPWRYTAKVTLLPPQQNSSVGSAIASQLNSMGGMAALAGGGLGLKNQNEMYVAMLKSRTVEDAMVQHFGLMQEYHRRYISDARKAFEGHAEIEANGKDGLIHISIEASDPNRAAELANGYVDQFRGLSEHLAITEAAQRRLFFERQLVQAKDNLANAEEAMKVMQQNTGMIQLESQARALIESAASLRAQVAAKEVQVDSLRTFATGENTQLVQAQQELESLRAQVAKLGGSAYLDAGLIVPKGQVPKAGIEYVRKLREVKYSETIFEILARQFEIAKLDEAKQGSLVQVVDPAVPPDKRSSPKRALIVIGATALGFFFAVSLAVLQAGLSRIKKDPDTAEKFAFLKRALAFGKPSDGS